MSARDVARRRYRRRFHAHQARRNVVELTSISFLVLIALVIVIVGSGLAGAAVLMSSKYDGYVGELATADDVVSRLPRGGSRIYDRNGILLYEFANSGLHAPVPLSAVSPFVLKATVATEDASFWQNNGLNTRGLMRAAIENSPWRDGWLQGSGGSSISQQLAKTVFIPREDRSDRNVGRKLKESALALELNRHFSKEQILEWYLNSISYGGVYIGIEAAAQGYFGTPASDLTLAQAALLAGIPQQPSAYGPTVDLESALKRQREVLGLMVAHGVITTEEADAASQEPITLVSKTSSLQAPHFVFGPVAAEIERRFGANALYEGGLDIVTSLDFSLQQQAQAILEKWIAQNERTANGHNGAMVALDPTTGQILVYIGSRDYYRDDIQGQNDMNVALRSPGSTLKPFTYLGAFERGWSTGTGVIDVPLSIQDPWTGSWYEVRNPIKGTYQGVIPVAKALGNSLNVPAVNTALFVGVDNVVTTLRQAGFTTLDPNPNAYGPAITVGGVNVTLADLVYGSSTLAAGGVRRGGSNPAGRVAPDRQVDPAAILKVTDENSGKVLYDFEAAQEQAFPASFPYMVSSILSDGNNQCITFGVCGALSLPNRPAAIKTGTSEPFENRTDLIGDTWAVGYTPQLAAGTWFGNSDNTPMANIFSTTVSYQAWREFMILAHDYLKLPPAQFVRPDTVVEREICTPSGKLATDLCPRGLRQKALFAAETLQEPNPIALKDDWWQPGNGGVRLVAPPQLQYWGGFGAWVGRAATGSSAPGPASPAPAPASRPPAPVVSPTPQPSQPSSPAQPSPPIAPTVPPAPTVTSAPSPETTSIPAPTQRPSEPTSTVSPQATGNTTTGGRTQ